PLGAAIRERNRVPLGAATPEPEPGSVGSCHPGSGTEFRCELLAGRTEPSSVGSCQLRTEPGSAGSCHPGTEPSSVGSCWPGEQN
ncbi:hypothetical protein, partial [[Clostridium] symbiosum]|uniref:hypothetical protein n=1 Tax=Clostridium symbiosum TaxID=1512 RepID=UPI003219AD04